jgi:hypothetical protein
MWLRPPVTGALVERERKNSLMREALIASAFYRAEGLPRAIFVQAEAVFGARPNAVAVDQHAEDVIVGQAVRGGEILPAEHGHLLGPGNGRDCQERQQDLREDTREILRSA